MKLCMMWRWGHIHSVTALSREKISPVPTALKSDWICSRCQRDSERVDFVHSRSRTSAIESTVTHYTDLTITGVFKILLIWNTLLKFIFIPPKFLETQFRNHHLTTFRYISLSCNYLRGLVFKLSDLRGLVCNCPLVSKHAVELPKFIDVVFLFMYVCSHVRDIVSL
jgi:hypothetical protein